MALDADHAQARLGQLSGDVLAARPQADHHNIHFVGAHGIESRAAWIRSARP